jgi:hypothetical protein
VVIDEYRTWQNNDWLGGGGDEDEELSNMLECHYVYLWFI